MGNHEIRLRRKSMTSRRIERHKNYAQLMNQHQKSQRLKKIAMWLIYAFISFLVFFAIYYSLHHKKKKTIEQHSHITSINVNTTT